MPPGMLIRGKIVEAGSDKPVAGAAVLYESHSMQNSEPGGSSGRARTAADGSFRFAAPPIPGHLSVMEPGEDYVLQGIGDEMLFSGQPGGRRFYANAFVACDPRPGTKSLEVDVVLRRGVTIKGQVSGPDGHPLGNVWMISRIMLGPRQGTARKPSVGRRARQRAPRPLRDPRTRPRGQGPRAFLRAQAEAGRDG